MQDVVYFLQFYSVVFLLGLGMWPLGRILFSAFAEKGWVLSKVLGIALVSYCVWMFGILKLVPFSFQNTLFIAIVLSLIAWSSYSISCKKKGIPILQNTPWRLMFVSEFFFILTLAGWAIIRAYNPNIHGLEKFMDYGFVLSILRADYFPPIDHFFASEPINYYYFGHHVAAVLTKISLLPPSVTYNLQIALLFALSFMGSFSIVATLIMRMTDNVSKVVMTFAGTIGGILTAATGNLHAILNVTKLDSYWYATASRLIPYTINEFPLYSFVVADLHAHVSNIPHALVAIGLLVNMVFTYDNEKNTQRPFFFHHTVAISLPFLALMVGISYATNSWDFPIYLLLSGLVFLYLTWVQFHQTITDRSTLAWSIVRDSLFGGIVLLIMSILLVFPFWLTVKPISDGIGIVHDLSPVKEFLTLWGMYIFVALVFVLFVFRKTFASFFTISSLKKALVASVAKILGVSIQVKHTPPSPRLPLSRSDSVALMLIILGGLLLLLPEIVYVRDIYTPDYYRANTMFKLYYGAWIMFSIACGYAFVRMVYIVKRESPTLLGRLGILLSYVLIAMTLLYPYMAIKTVTDSFKLFYGLDGTHYLSNTFPNDYETIHWINKNISGQPVILEAVGDSYTDYARIAANTGLPTVLGWPVHEWLWRGTYGEPVQPPSRVLELYGSDTVAQRVEDVKTIYTSTDQDAVWQLLKKYDVSYIYMSTLEQEKYGEVQTEFLASLGEIVFSTEHSRLIRITS